MSEEDDVKQSESPFRDYFTKIYDDKIINCATFESDEYKKLLENPYYSPNYLKNILSLYLPVAPIWSNLMMGNLSRYGYRSVEPIEHCGCRNSRTTGISESRMKVVKRTILYNKVYSRVDQVVQKLGERIRETEINYSNHYLLNLTRNRNRRTATTTRTTSNTHAANNTRAASTATTTRTTSNTHAANNTRAASIATTTRTTSNTRAVGTATTTHAANNTRAAGTATTTNHAVNNTPAAGTATTTNHARDVRGTKF